VRFLLVAVGFVAAGVFAAFALAGVAFTRTQVVATEYSFAFSRTHLKAGHAVIELANFGQDQHDLRLQRVGSRHVAGIGIVDPGARADLNLKLAPGRYLVWCSVANHRALGMRATLVVTR
jgi:plastocyanin